MLVFMHVDSAFGGYYINANTFKHLSPVHMHACTSLYIHGGLGLDTRSNKALELENT